MADCPPIKQEGEAIQLTSTYLVQPLRKISSLCPTYETGAEGEGLDQLDLCGEDAAVDFTLLLVLTQLVAKASEQAAGARRSQGGQGGAGWPAGGPGRRLPGGRDQRRLSARRPGWTKPQPAHECCHFHYLE